MKSVSIFLACIAFVAVSCGEADPNKQIDEGNVKDRIYESKQIGWSIEIPKGWTIVSRDKLEANDQRGKDAIEKVYEGEIDTKGLKHLISFQKDKFNVFASTSEPFQEEFPGEYEQNNMALNNLLYETFAGQGIRIDTSSGKEPIQGLEFNTFYSTIYSGDGKVILKQTLYSQLINGHDFGVTLSYNNDQDKKTMVDALKNSRFNKK